jgi:ACS family hexuronate transporter-like MFS transporter
LEQTAAVAISNSDVVARIGRYRWRICAMLFLATTINYVDRQVLGVLAPELQHVIGWNEIQYSNIVNAFTAAYAIGMLLAGRFIDRVGLRNGYSVSIAIWSVAAAAHALVRTVLGFGVVRFALGLGESGNFPAAIKTVAEWFPKKERALATGIFNSGANIGAMIAPLAVPWLAVRYGWQSAFLATSVVSASWIVLWRIIYRPPREHLRLSTAELAYIQSEPPEAAVKMPWSYLLGRRQTWAYLVGKFMTDPIWWLFMFWLPKFLSTRHGLSLVELGWPLVIVYNFATLGSIIGGWLPARFFSLGWSANRARKWAMLTCALGVTPVVFAASTKSLWLSVALLALGAACHQGWSCNMFTLASDLFPKRAVGSVVGIGGFGGAVGSMLIATFTGLVLQFTGSYVPMFIIAGSTYLIALLVIHILVPGLEPARMESDSAVPE